MECLTASIPPQLLSPRIDTRNGERDVLVSADWGIEHLAVVLVPDCLVGNEHINAGSRGRDSDPL
jgi:hypothetical protein